MLRVLIVDDEPFIAQGLSKLIDWAGQGFEIVKIAENGQEALDYIREKKVDLILADIQMPVMTGLELLEIIRKENLSDASFVILSGYNDFSYAQRALRGSCMDYILKPVQKENLLELLKRVAREKEITEIEVEKKRRMQRMYLVKDLLALIRGRYEQSQLEYVKENLRLSGGMRYIHVSLDNVTVLEEFSDDEMKEKREKLLKNCGDYLGGDMDHCILDAPDYEEDYELGLLFCDYMAQERKTEVKDFLEQLQKAAGRGLAMPVVLLVGKPVEDISRISHSYSTACVLRPFQSFEVKKDIYYYEEEIQASESKIVLCKQNLDRLIQAVEQNDQIQIKKNVDELFAEMEKMGMSDAVISMNTNYLLFQMIHLAVEQDETVNQETVMHYLSENVCEAGMTRGGRIHLRRFACEFAEYLVQMRRNMSRGVLQEVEREVRENYAQNLTLRELSKKYYVNSSYLGQIFRKRYGQSFKDYLCNYRINEAAQQLLRTDKKISAIAEEVGYHDPDYFIQKFIEQKGCTPARYRRQGGSQESSQEG